METATQEAPVQTPIEATDPGTELNIGSPNLDRALDEAMDRVFPSTAKAAAEERTAAKPDVEPAKTVESPAKSEETVATKTETVDTKEKKEPGEFNPPEELFEPAGAKKAATDPDEVTEAEIPAEIKDPKQRESWGRLRRNEKRLERENQKLVSENTKLKNDPVAGDEALKARLSQAEKENAEFKQRQALMDVETSDEYQNHFVVQRREMLTAALGIAKTAGVETGVLETALLLQGEARRKALDEIYRGIDSDTLKFNLGRVVGQIEDRDDQKRAVLQDSEGNLKQLRERRLAQQHKQIEVESKQMRSIVKGAIDWAASEEGKQVAFRFIPGNDAWNKQVEDRRAAVENFVMNTSDRNAIALCAVDAAASRWNLEMLLRARSDNKELRKQLSEYQQAKPSLGNEGKQADLGGGIDPSIPFEKAVAMDSGLP